MAMNVNLIKQKLASLQTRGNTGRSKIAESIWKAPIGKFQVRMIPAKWDRENPFKEVFFHYGINNRTMISLINFGEKDPIVEFSESLKKQTYTVENFKLAKKLEPKMRVFAPVIVRGEEDKGVRLWEFGKEVYMELLAIAEDEDVEDYTDTYQGRDLIVETVGPDQSGRQFNKTSVRVKTKQTPASEDAKQVKAWLEAQPDPLELYKKPTYEELKQGLYEWLNPGSSEETEEAEEPKAETPTAPAPATSASKYSLNVKQKPDIDKEFDDLFKTDSTTNDLPF
jgi:hypothetical protein